MSVNLNSRATSLQGKTPSERLAQQIAMALTRSGYTEFDELDIKVKGEKVWITGCLSSYFLRQKAESIVLGIPGLSQVRSEIVVLPPYLR